MLLSRLLPCVKICSDKISNILQQSASFGLCLIAMKTDNCQNFCENLKTSISSFYLVFAKKIPQTKNELHKYFGNSLPSISMVKSSLLNFVVVAQLRGIKKLRRFERLVAKSQLTRILVVPFQILSYTYWISGSSQLSDLAEPASGYLRYSDVPAQSNYPSGNVSNRIGFQ